MNTQIKRNLLDHILLQNCHTAFFIGHEFNRQGDLPSLRGNLSISLSPHGNGVQQIAQVLTECPQVHTVHIYTGGEPGKLILGNVHLTADTIDQYAWDIQSWFGFIPSFIKPSLILDGCKFGDGEQGVALIHRLHHLTGSHITCRQSSIRRHLQLV